MCYPPLAWQTYDIDFTGARFDDAWQRRITNAVVNLRHNGVPIHENFELPKLTPGDARRKPPAKGPSNCRITATRCVIATFGLSRSEKRCQEPCPVDDERLPRKSGTAAPAATRIRQEITAGIYETAERLSVAVDALSADLEGRDDRSAGRDAARNRHLHRPPALPAPGFPRGHILASPRTCKP